MHRQLELDPRSPDHQAVLFHHVIHCSLQPCLSLCQNVVKNHLSCSPSKADLPILYFHRSLQTPRNWMCTVTYGVGFEISLFPTALLATIFQHKLTLGLFKIVLISSPTRDKPIWSLEDNQWNLDRFGGFENDMLI